MNELIGSNLYVFVGLTLILIGGAAAMTGNVLAANWRPLWQVVFYCLLLGVVNRFLVYALFDGPLLSALAYLINTAFLIGIGLVSFRITRVKRMLTQYPWRYQRAGLMGWRMRPESANQEK